MALLECCRLRGLALALTGSDELAQRIQEIRGRLAQILSSQERALLSTELRDLEQQARLPNPIQTSVWCARGLVDLRPDGRAIITLRPTSNVADFFHAFVHTLRRSLPKETISKLEEWLEIKDGKWRPDCEERLACAFERFLWDGDWSSDAEDFLSRSKIVEAMHEAYPSVEGTPIDLAFPPFVRAEFGRWLERLPAPEPDAASDMALAPVQTRRPDPIAKSRPFTRSLGFLPWQLAIACTLAAALGLSKLPYGFYVLLRSTFCLAAAIGFAHAYPAKSTWWLWAYGAIAFFYNPIFPVRLGSKGLWAFLNLATLALFWVGVWFPGGARPSKARTSNS